MRVALASGMHRRRSLARVAQAERQPHINHVVVHRLAGWQQLVPAACRTTRNALAWCPPSPWHIKFYCMYRPQRLPVAYCWRPVRACTVLWARVSLQGLKDVHEMLVNVAKSLIRGGETGVFTPMHMLVFKKPLASKKQ